MIVTLVSQKGGTGKSSLCAHLATEWISRGRRVLLVDADPQGSTLAWGEARAELGLTSPTVTAVGDNVREAVTDLAANYDVTLIDTAGRRSKRVVASLSVADVALIPCQPAGFDLWSLDATTNLVAEVQELRPNLLAALVLNSMAQTILGAEGLKAVQELDIPMLGKLGRRVAFAESTSAGQGVCERASGSLAALEIRNVADAIEDLHADGNRANVA